MDMGTEGRLAYQVAFWREGAGAWGKVRGFGTRDEAASFIADLFADRVSSSGREIPAPTLLRFEFYGFETAEPEAHVAELGGSGVTVLGVLVDGMSWREWRSAVLRSGVHERTWARWRKALPARGLVNVSRHGLVFSTPAGRQVLARMTGDATTS